MMELDVRDVMISHGAWHLAVSGTFRPGIHLVSGRVGSGKSTFACLAAGMQEPDKGEFVRDGINSVMLSLQFPEYHLTGSTLEEEIRSYGLDPGSILKSSEIYRCQTDDPLSLSRGELKRLHLACVLSHRYDLLILDEPYSALDCIQKRNVCRKITAAAGGIVVICTHEQHFFPRVDYLWEILGGTLVFHGRIPEAISGWQMAPPVIKEMERRGVRVRGLTEEDIEEALCRMHE